LRGYVGAKGLCDKYPMPVIRKTQYKTQMVYPIPGAARGCHPLGRFDLLWSSGKQFPYKGEDYGYVIWRKRNCCLM
ncbi:MAG: TraU family protein, partial [Alphaproteobacteria bacterium]|nr:TraU family protein [Alphaproteobacteria bacterium]